MTIPVACTPPKHQLPLTSKLLSSPHMSPIVHTADSQILPATSRLSKLFFVFLKKIAHRTCDIHLHVFSVPLVLLVVHNKNFIDFRSHHSFSGTLSFPLVLVFFSSSENKHTQDQRLLTKRDPGDRPGEYVSFRLVLFVTKCDTWESTPHPPSGVSNV